MTPRKRNMLEAFQDGLSSPSPAATPAATPADPPARRSPGTRKAAASPPPAGRPGRTDPGRAPADGARAPAPRADAPRRLGPPWLGTARGGIGTAGWVPAAAISAAVGILLLGFWLGRASAGWWGESPAPAAGQGLVLETRVADGFTAAPRREPDAGPQRGPQGAVPGEPAPRSAPEPPPAVPEGYTADDLAFLDRSNRVTLRAISFDPTPAGRQKALTSYAHLRANGIPAVAPFVAGDLLLLCVGAAPSVRDPELERVRQRLLALEGPPPRSEPAPYASAFIVNIDDVVVRD